MFGGICFFASISMFAEAPIDRLKLGIQEHTFWNCCWEAICTMSSVGYGDIYPKTYIGRIANFGSIIFGVVIIS